MYRNTCAHIQVPVQYLSLLASERQQTKHSIPLMLHEYQHYSRI